MSTATHQSPLRARHRVGNPSQARRFDRGSHASSVVTPCHNYRKPPCETQPENQKPARRFHRNQQYSITALTDGGGSIVERYAYTAYGQVTFANAGGTVQSTSASNNRYTNTGREWDEGLSLYHYRARMYDAVAGRFISRDPIGYEDGKNLYRTYHMPGRLDPSGLSVRPWTEPPLWPRPAEGAGPGQCKLKWRCWRIAHEEHCGLIMALDNEIYSIDGTGGSQNHIDWPETAFMPDNENYEGRWTNVSMQTCECLRERSRQWNRNHVPRGNISCNSNTTLGCLTRKCNLLLNFGKRGDPYRYNRDCRVCIRYEWRRMYCGKKCVEWQSFCDQGFAGAPPRSPEDPFTVLPSR